MKIFHNLKAWSKNRVKKEWDISWRATMAPPWWWIVMVVLFALWLASTILPSHAATFTYTYDPLNRLTNAAYSDGSSEAYSYDSAGNRLSRITSATTGSSDVTPPSVPTNLVSTAFIPSQLSIAWNRSFDAGGSGLAGYQIYVNGSLVVTTSGTNFLLSGLMPSTQYCLTVAAHDHSGNISAQSLPLCLTTPAFQQPFLSPLGFAGGQFKIGIGSGTPGPYDILVSSNLINWQPWTNLVLPAPGNLFVDPTTSGFNQRFYRFRWSTNTPAL